MPTLHRPFDPAVEHAFLTQERVRSRKLARIAAIASAVIVSVNFLIGVALFGERAGWATCLTAVLATLAVVRVTGARAYLTTPSLDLVAALAMWAVLAVDFVEQGRAFGTFRDYPRFSAHDEMRVFYTCVVQLFIASIYTSLFFLGNFRTYLYYTIVSAAIYALLVAMLIGFQPAVKLLFLALLILGVALYFNRERETGHRARFWTGVLLDRERVRTEELLYNVLPQPVVARLKAGETVVDAYARLTVVFVDVAGFSQLAKRVSPDALIDLLNRFFRAADRCAERHGVEKVKTIGDAYLAVAGGVSSAAAGPVEAVRFAIDLIAAVADLDAGDIGFDIRVGIHSGPAIGGVIGETRLAYDYWGDTMNIAARIEGCAPLGGLAVSAATHAVVAGTMACAYDPPRTVALKGVGETVVHPWRP